MNINRSHFTLGRRPGQRGNDNLNKNNNDNLTPKVEQTGQFGRETWRARLSERLIGLDSGHPRGDTPQPAGAREGGRGRWELEFRAVTSVFGKLSAQKDAKPGFKWTPS